MNTESSKAPLEVTSNEKLLSMISHLSLILGTAGLITAVVIWATQAEKSKFVRYNSLQAIFYHLSLIAVIMIMVVIMIFFLLLFGMKEGLFKHHYMHDTQLPVSMIIIMIIFGGGILLLTLAAIAYAIYMAVKSNEGYAIKIPVIGNFINY